MNRAACCYRIPDNSIGIWLKYERFRGASLSEAMRVGAGKKLSLRGSAKLRVLVRVRASGHCLAFTGPFRLEGFDVLEAWLAARPEPVEQVVMESSGHYWMPLASHLGRRGVTVSVVNPLAAKYFARSRLGRTKSDPADARSLAEMGMREQLPARDPLAGFTYFLEGRDVWSYTMPAAPALSSAQQASESIEVLWGR